MLKKNLSLAAAGAMAVALMVGIVALPTTSAEAVDFACQERCGTAALACSINCYDLYGNGPENYQCNCDCDRELEACSAACL